MAMPALDAYIFGYRRISTPPEQRARLATALIRLGIASREERDGSFILREADFKRFRAYAGGRIRYTVGEVEGLFGAILGLRRHIPSLVALVFGIVMAFLLSGLVWDVRVEGEEGLSDAEVESMLEQVGFGLGSVWHEVDTVKVESELRSKYPEIAWVQINRSGTVAYVTVKEREGMSEEDTPAPKLSNIVADRDGVIEEITVKSGRAEVKPGDVVKAGDILISGIVENDGHGYLVRAEGTVIARTAGELKASVQRTEYTESVSEGEKYSTALEIFGHTINIYKKYGNLDDGCVIIDDEGEYLLLGGVRLPLRIKRQYLSYTERECVTYTDDELPTLASSRLQDMLGSALVSADLIKLRTRGEYTEDGYVMTAEYVYAAEIGEEREILIQNR